MPSLAFSRLARMLSAYGIDSSILCRWELKAWTTRQRRRPQHSVDGRLLRPLFSTVIPLVEKVENRMS